MGLWRFRLACVAVLSLLMHGVAATLDDGSIQSLAAWLEGLAPATTE
jgi:hypothetical protein